MLVVWYKNYIVVHYSKNKCSTIQYSKTISRTPSAVLCSFCYWQYSVGVFTEHFITIHDSMFQYIRVNHSILQYVSVHNITKQHINQITKNISKWALYPQLAIQNHQLGISYPTGDWGYLKPGNWTRKQIPNPQLFKSPIRVDLSSVDSSRVAVSILLVYFRGPGASWRYCPAP